jgi:hypothetical protein
LDKKTTGISRILGLLGVLMSSISVNSPKDFQDS